MDEAEYLSRIYVADQYMLTEAHQRSQDVVGVGFDETLAWPGDLEVLLQRSSNLGLLHIQYITERYYSKQIKASTDVGVQDQLLALAYLRVVNLQLLRDEPDMGFTERELEFVLAAVRKYKVTKGREPVLLEIGCGAGSLLKALAQSGLRSINGADIAASAVNLARKGLAPYGLEDKVHQATTTHLLDRGYTKAFDMILLCDVIEHIPLNRVESFLAEVRQLLRNEGMLVIITPSSFTGPHDVTRHFQPPHVKPEGLHLHEYSLQELTSLLNQAGFGRFMGVRVLDCIPSSRGLRLSVRSMRFRLIMERIFPCMPLAVIRRTVGNLYFSAVCSWSD